MGFLEANDLFAGLEGPLPDVCERGWIARVNYPGLFCDGWIVTIEEDKVLAHPINDRMIGVRIDRTKIADGISKLWLPPERLSLVSKAPQ